jgi:type IV secretory pathway VirB3-like protein
LYIADPAIKVITGYKVTYERNGMKRERVFKVAKRASRFQNRLPWGSNSRMAPITRTPKANG